MADVISTEQQLAAALNGLVNTGVIDAWSRQESPASEAVYFKADYGKGDFTIRLAQHPVQRPGPQFLLGEHAGADSADPADAVQAVRQWAEDMKAAARSLG